MPRATDLPILPPRDPEGHKGTFGTVQVVGGCARLDTRMIGAPTLTAAAALRAGCGLSKLAMPAPIIDAGLVLSPNSTGRGIPTEADGSIIPHEAATVIDEVVAGCDCLAIGPGLGRGDGPRAAALRAVQQETVPVVVDADALNALSEIPQLTRDLHGAAVLTPHPGEFRRLVRGLGMTDDLGLSRSRQRAAEQLAQRLGCIVVLKGKGTVVSDGARTWTNTSGHPVLATGGTGDVLTGVIAGFIAQFVAPSPAVTLPAAIAAQRPKPPGKPLDLFDAVRVAVQVHGLAGERWAERTGAQGGMLATDLLSELPAVVEAMR